MAYLDGVVKFQRRFKGKYVAPPELLKDISLWRDALYKTGLIGRNPNKYSGLGYGNISQRLTMDFVPAYKKRFVITGSQTGHLESLKPEDYAIVYEYYPAENLVVEGGLTRASSEALTHGAIYDLDSSIGSIVHCHCPEIWNHTLDLKIPMTDMKVEAGTPQLAAEVSRLYKETDFKKVGIFSISSHEDGLFTFGRDPAEAVSRVFEYLSKAKYLIY